MRTDELKIKLQKHKKEWTALAKDAGISRKTIERIASGRTDPRSSIVEKLSDLLASQ